MAGQDTNILYRTEVCSLCKGTYPYPVELHHSEEGCRARKLHNADPTSVFFKWAVRGRVFSFEQDDLPGEGYKFKIKTFHIEAAVMEDALDAARFHVKRNLKMRGFFPLSVKCENLPLK